MKVPAFEESGVLPPFLGDSPAERDNNRQLNSPYKVSLQNFVDHFSTSPERVKILIGFLQYRLKLKEIGFESGFQWIDGSFVENVELVESRPPNDIDIVTFFRYKQPMTREIIRSLVAENPF